MHRSILLFLFLLVLFASDAIAQSIATISVSDITVSEGDATATFSVTHHGADVSGGFTITVVSQDMTADSNDYTAVNTGLIFTGTAGETKTVQIPIIDNRIAEGPETFTLNMSIAGTTETVDIPDRVTVTILDDDILAISVEGPAGSTARSISVNEDIGDAMICIRFNIAYDIEFDINAFSSRLTGTPNVDYQAIDRTLTATITDIRERCFPFAIVDDPHVEDDETLDVSIFFARPPSLNLDLTNATLRYTIIDNDNAVLSVDEIMVDENAGHADVVVAVNKRVEETFTVGVSTLDGTAMMGMDYGALTNAPLIFPARTDTPMNSDTGVTQTIRVPIVDDFIMEDTETFSISFTHLENTGVSNRITLPAPTTVTISDNDVTTIGIVLSSPLLTVDEGNSNTYTVVLNTQPTTEVTVTINDEGDVSAMPSFLTFTTTDWANPQMVTVNAAQDDDAFNDIAILAHNAAGGNYDSLTANLHVTVDDDDIAGITLSPEFLSVDEGDSNTYTVVLNTLPTTEVTVTISSRGDITAMPSVLTFTEADWSDPQMVTANARQEDNDALNDNAALSHIAAGNEYDAVLKNLSVTIIDDDTARFTFTPSPLTVPEGGSATYDITLTLSVEDPDDVHPNIISSDDDITVTQSRATFEIISDELVPITITVHARHDDDAADKEVTLQHTAIDLNNTGYNMLMQDFVITIRDDDIAGFTFNPTTTLSVAEGFNGIYTVVLNTEPTDALTVTIESNNDAVTVTPPSLDFTVSNWRVPQPVMVNVAEDDNAVNDDVMLTHTASGGDYGANNVMGALSITTEDNDTAGISFSSANVIMDEEIVQIYTVVLDTEPTTGVTVAIGSDNTDVTVSPETLTFNPTSWNTAQTVRITAAHDDDAVNDDVNLTHIAMGGDYGDNSVMATLPVEVIDNDTPGISFNPASVTVAEGTTQTYTVVLNTQPTFEVTFIIGSNNADVTVNPPGLGPLTFSTTNWDDPQEVEITAAHDDDAVNDDANLTHTASGGDYTTANVSRALSVTVNDDDTAGISFNPASASVTVDEGTTQTYTVVLDTEPIADVTVTIDQESTSRLTISPSELRFTTTNWDMAQSVTVDTGDVDDDNDGYTETFTHTATGGDYADVTTDLTVIVNDTDMESRDSRLSMLTISAEDGTDLSSGLKQSFDPEQSFDPNIADYVLAVDGTNSTNIMVTATLSDADSARAELILNEMESNPVISGSAETVGLEAGRNNLQIVVTAESGSSRTYTITVTKINQVVLNDVRLVVATDPDCNAPVAAVSIMNTDGYSACVERFPMDTAGMVLFTTFLDADTFTTQRATLAMNSTRTDMPYMVDAAVPSSLTYLMMSVFFDDTEVYVARYPITNIADADLEDTDNDGIPDTEERGTNSPTNLVIADMAAGTTMRQITVPQGHRIALGDAARRAAIAGLESSGGLTYTAELRLSTTELASIGISEPDGYNREGIYDFVVYLPTVDNVASIVIPLASPLTAGLGYMKYKDGVWSAFVDDNMAYPNDKYYSAPREDMRVNNMGMPEFICPLHNDLEKWRLRMPQQPLTMGHRCILLRIEDGGPNDADGIPNGIVADPGALASISGGGSGGGASDLWFILLLTLINLAVFVLLRKQIASTQRK